MRVSTKTIFTIIIIGIFFLGFCGLNNIPFENHIDEEKEIQINSEYNTQEPETSGNWVLTNITIDDTAPYGGGSMTWAQAELNLDWVTGAGTLGSPYLIENVTINGQGIRSCINITDSYAYFTINNCTLTNSGSSADYAGIYLAKVNNGTISDSIIQSNYFGIYMNNCTNTTISNNLIDINQYGIGMINSTSSTYNEIRECNITNNLRDGVNFLRSNSTFIALNNITLNGDDGIYLEECDTIDIGDNNIAENLDNGINFLTVSYTHLTLPTTPYV